MFPPFSTYTRWLHTKWPAGTVEKLPLVHGDGSTNVPGIYLVGDLTGIPLLKFSSDTGARAVRTIAEDAGFQKLQRDKEPGVHDLVILGAGVAGMAAALEAEKRGLDYVLIEAAQPFSTIVNFPKAKPIYTYPTEMVPEGELQFTAQVKEPLIEELEEQTASIEPMIARAEKVVRDGRWQRVVLPDRDDLRACRVIVAIGRSGNFRKLGVTGEELDKVSNRLHDPKDFDGQNVLVVGGGDSALEAAIALAEAGAEVTLSYRKKEFSRPKPDNVDAIERLGESEDGDDGQGSLTLALGTEVKEISADSVTLNGGDGERSVDNDAVFAMIGREAPLDFFRRSGIEIQGELRAKDWTFLGLFVAFCVFLYNWKAGKGLTKWFQENGLFPFGAYESTLKTWFDDPSTLLGTLAISVTQPAFYYTLAYSTVIVVFGIDRIRRRRTPYITWQTTTLMAFQVVPLFLLPLVILPWMGHNGWFDSGLFGTAADNLFPASGGAEHGREYWRAFGFILAWPLFIWNFFTYEPMTWWLVIGCVQTFVLIPLLVWRYGKGAYCGWICSCGALAETLGDRHRHKMPHGLFWNRLNMVGQVILWVALSLFALRIYSWVDLPGAAAVSGFYDGMLSGWTIGGYPVNYYWIVDIWLAGILGVGLYFWFSGRTWCRFACPLAALMHIYARFTRFRIFAEKKKCISCNVCTSVCHQGIDVMNFANKGAPMEDPECVRCSACVQSCPTGVLAFGQLDKKTGAQHLDSLPASPVRMRES